MDAREKLVELLVEFVEVDAWDNGEFIEKDIDFKEIASNLIANGVTVQQWISASDRFPERTGSYIVCTDKGAICTAKFYSDFPTGFRYKEQHWNNSRLNKHITHWMPLPQPPKGD